MAVTVTTHGAASEVTGSMHLVEANGDRILLDCGLFQGRRAEARVHNQELPFDARSLTSVVLSHAHIDHCGLLPVLAKRGFRGPIFATPATHDLATILLEDAAYIQQKDAEFFNKKASRRQSADRIEPLYDIEDARFALDQFRTIPYGYAFDCGRGVRCTFRDAGHILGSASVALEIDRPGERPARVTFTGDLGRGGMPILRDPAPFPGGDLILCESTYGDRVHPPVGDQAEELLKVIVETAARGGKVIVPAFSVGRTQNLVYQLHRLFLAKRLPELPIFVDSPLSAHATLVYRGHPECYDEETHRLFLEKGQDPLGFARLTFVTSTEASKALNDRKEPCVIIASSGMCEAGRILHHLAHNAPSAKNTILCVGFMAEHTLGRRIQEKAATLRIYGEDVTLNAEVVSISGFSGHADRDGLLDALGSISAEDRRRIVLVHGEPKPATALKARIEETLGGDATVPRRGQRFTI